MYFFTRVPHGYEALGFGGSPKTTGNGVALPDGFAYFTSRAASMGQVPGEVAAAAFGVFDPVAVVFGVTHGWSLTDAPHIGAARATGAVAQLARILGPEPDGIERAAALLARAGDGLQPAGRPLFAGLVIAARSRRPAGRGVAARRPAAGVPGRLPHRGVDQRRLRPHRDLRRHRGLVGAAAALYSRSRGWSAAALDEAVDRLRSSGDLDGDGLVGRRPGPTRRGRVRHRPPLPAHRRQPRRRHRRARSPSSSRGARPSATPAGYLPGGPHELAGKG